MAPNNNYLDVSPMIDIGGGSINFSAAGAAMNNNGSTGDISKTVQRFDAVVYADPGFVIVDDDENDSTEDNFVGFNTNVRNSDGVLLLDSDSDGGWDETAMTNENSNNYMLSSTTTTTTTTKTKTVKTTVPTRNRIGGTRSSSSTARSSSPRRIRFASAKGLSRISLARNSSSSSKQINNGNNNNSSNSSRGGVPTSSYTVMESYDDDLGGNQSKSSAKAAAIKVKKSALSRTVKSCLVNIIKPNNNASSSSDAKEMAAYEFQDMNDNNDEEYDDDDYNSNDDEIDNDSNNKLPWTRAGDDGDILPMSDHEYDVDYYLDNDDESSDNDSISHNAIVDNDDGIENTLAVFNDDNENNDKEVVATTSTRMRSMGMSTNDNTVLPAIMITKNGVPTLVDNINNNNNNNKEGVIVEEENDWGEEYDDIGDINATTGTSCDELYVTCLQDDFVDDDDDDEDSAFLNDRNVTFDEGMEDETDDDDDHYYDKQDCKFDLASPWLEEQPTLLQYDVDDDGFPPHPSPRATAGADWVNFQELPFESRAHWVSLAGLFMADDNDDVGVGNGEDGVHFPPLVSPTSATTEEMTMTTTSSRGGIIDLDNTDQQQQQQHPLPSEVSSEACRRVRFMRTTTAAITPSDSIHNVMRQNNRLHVRQKEMAKLLGSAAEKFAAYENDTVQRIHVLEEENRRLLSTAIMATRTDSPYTLDEQKQQQRNEDEHDLNVTNVEKNYPMLASSVVESLRRVQQSELDVDENELVNDALLEPPAPLVHVDSLPREVVANDPPLSTVSTGGERNTVLLHRKNREVRRLKKELESALSDVIMLTEALESNNEALDAAVLELEERWTRWEREDEGTAACVDEDTNAELERLQSELREREFEVTCLQRELEEATKLGDELANTLTLTQAEISSKDRNLSAIVESPRNVETVDLSAVAAEERYDDLQRKFDNLMIDADVLKNDANVARVRITKLESDLKVREDEIERLRSSNKSATATAEMVNSTSRDLNPTEEEKLVNNNPQSSSQGGNLGFILANKKPDDYQVMQRDIKIKSLDAVICSQAKIIEKLNLDIGRINNEREEADYIASQKIEKLTEENKTYEIQVAGFEATFRKVNEQRSVGVTPNSTLHDDDDEIVDEDWDEQVDGEVKDEGADFRSQNLSLQKTIEELQSTRAFQEGQMDILKAELVKLRVQSQQDKECALEVSEENKIISAQHSALENQFVEINNSSSDPVLVSKAVMLEKKNKVLETTVKSIRSDMQKKIAPLLYRIALAEEEKRIVVDEMNNKVHSRDETIANLENSLRQYRALQQSKKKRLSLKKKASKGSESLDA